MNTIVSVCMGWLLGVMTVFYVLTFDADQQVSLSDFKDIFMGSKENILTRD